LSERDRRLGAEDSGEAFLLVWKRPGRELAVRGHLDGEGAADLVC
jgi:hypothetical protein